jgi:hypothetical protein
MIASNFSVQFIHKPGGILLNKGPLLLSGPPQLIDPSEEVDHGNEPEQHYAWIQDEEYVIQNSHIF